MKVGWKKSLWTSLLAVTMGAGSLLGHGAKNPPPLAAIRTLTMQNAGPMVSVYRPRSLAESRDAVEAFMRASRRAPEAPHVSVPPVTFMDYFGPPVLTAKTTDGTLLIYPDYRIVKSQGGGYRFVYCDPYLVIQRGRIRTYIKNAAWDLWFIRNQWQSSFVRR